VSLRVYISAPTAALRAGLQAMLAGPGIELLGSATMPNQQAIAADVLVFAEPTQLDDAWWAGAGDVPPGVVLLSEDPHAAIRLRNMAVRGWALISADAGADELHAAVVAAGQGLVLLPRELADSLFQQRVPVGEPAEEPLTVREHEVLELLSQGLPNKLIARELQISEHTVKFHVSAIFAKLGATSRTEAVSRGARRGLISL
jgi:DNA-binding NarL/FixJ family response regulator